MEHNSTDFLEEFGELEIAPAHEEHLPSENTKPSENTPMTELETIEFNSDSNQAAIINPTWSWLIIHFIDGYICHIFKH